MFLAVLSRLTASKRRLLYVACTRAQSLLYLSHSSKRKVGGETKTKEISEFVAAATKEHSVSCFKCR